MGSLFNDRGFLDDDVFSGYVLVEAAAAGLHGLDRVDHFGAFHDLAEHGITPAVGGGGGVVQEVVVGHVDEELCRGRVRVGRTGHGDGVALVLEAVVGFVFDGVAGALLLHAGFEPAALNHEVVDHAVEHRAVVKAVAHVVQEVFGGLGCFRGVQFDDDVALAGLKLDAGFGGHGGVTFFCCGGVGGCCMGARQKQGAGEQGGADPAQAGARQNGMQSDVSHVVSTAVVCSSEKGYCPVWAARKDSWARSSCTRPMLARASRYSGLACSAISSAWRAISSLPVFTYSAARLFQGSGSSG